MVGRPDKDSLDSLYAVSRADKGSCYSSLSGSISKTMTSLNCVLSFSFVYILIMRSMSRNMSPSS